MQEPELADLILDAFEADNYKRIIELYNERRNTISAEERKEILCELAYSYATVWDFESFLAICNEAIDYEIAEKSTGSENKISLLVINHIDYLIKNKGYWAAYNQLNSYKKRFSFSAKLAALYTKTEDHLYKKQIKPFIDFSFPVILIVLVLLYGLNIINISKTLYYSIMVIDISILVFTGVFQKKTKQILLPLVSPLFNK